MAVSEAIRNSHPIIIFLPESGVLFLKPLLRLSRGQVRFNAGKDLLLEGFGDVIDAAGGKGFHLVDGLLQAADENYGDVAGETVPL